MFDCIDFGVYPQSNTFYGGSERKVGVLVGNDEYMLKFRKRDAFGQLRANHVSEFLGSRIFSMFGLETQTTYLGTYRGEEVVACKNFLAPGEQFVPFNDVGESSLERDKERFQYSYDDIIAMLEANRKLTDTAETISTFWEMFIIDALLGNFDRHGANWGFIKHANRYRIAPVFDNGSCLFPKLVDDQEISRIMGDEAECRSRVFTFPTSQILLRGTKSSYYEVISSLRFEECNRALCLAVERCDIERIVSLVQEVPFTSVVRREFLAKMLRLRYELILAEPYAKLKGLS